MATVSAILTNLNLFVDGRPFAGRVTELKVPVLKPSIREHVAGGLSAPYPVPMAMLEKMEAEFTLVGADPDALAILRLVPGQTVPLRFLGAAFDNDGTCKQVEVVLRGYAEQMEQDAWKPNEAPSLKVTFFCAYYRYAVAGRIIHEVDPLNMVAIVDGRDQMAEARAALEIS